MTAAERLRELIDAANAEGVMDGEVSAALYACAAEIVAVLEPTTLYGSGKRCRECTGESIHVDGCTIGALDRALLKHMGKEEG